jgi:hypothetical protein
MRFGKTLTFLILATALVFALPVGARQKNVAPGLSPAIAAFKGGARTATFRSANPLTQDQIHAMVRDGFGDESGAKLIEQRGIDFAPSEDFIQPFKAAGASAAFLAETGRLEENKQQTESGMLRRERTHRGPPSSRKLIQTPSLNGA